MHIGFSFTMYKQGATVIQEAKQLLHQPLCIDLMRNVSYPFSVRTSLSSTPLKKMTMKSKQNETFFMAHKMAIQCDNVIPKTSTLHIYKSKLNIFFNEEPGKVCYLASK